MLRPILFALALGIPGAILAQPRSPILKVGDDAPALRVAKWIKGEPVSDLSQGRITVVEFWATWCGPCKVAIPHLTQLAKRYRGKAEFVGVDVLEQGADFMPKVEKMVAEFGSKMDYHVAADDDGFMVRNWLQASGGGGIPATYVVDGKGRLAWVGHPDSLEPVLRQMIAGKWDSAAFAREREEDARINKVDQGTIDRLNPLVRNPAATLAEIAKIVDAEPRVRYRRYVGHFTFNALYKSDSAKAIEFGKAWVAANELDPPYGDIADMVSWKEDAGKKLDTFAAECLEAQARRFGDHMDQGSIYDRAAQLRLRAGDRKKAAEDAQKAIAYAKSTPGYADEKAKAYAATLAKVKAN